MPDVFGHLDAQKRAVFDECDAFVDRQHRLLRGDRIVQRQELEQPIDVGDGFRQEDKLHWVFERLAASLTMARSLRRTDSKGTA